MIDRVLPLRVRGRRVLLRAQERGRAPGGAARVLLKGPPEALRRAEGYTFAAEGGVALTLAGVRLAPPPDGGAALLAFAEARPAPSAAPFPAGGGCATPAR